ncbi:MAG: PKD domain-containing protein [Candidatus Paceibacterota bacterium]|jgi:PKD repeat protein
MKKSIIGFFVLLTFLMSGFSTVQAMVLPPMPYYGSDPVISGVSGPQTLKVGQMGTWRVSAYDEEQSNLSYFVDWGERGMTTREVESMMTMPLLQQNSSFSHVYNDVGIYTVTFNVINDFGQSSTTSLTVNVKNGEVRPSLKVTSPNGGENIKIGQKYQITWDAKNLDGGVSIYLIDDSIKCPANIVGCWTSFGLGGGFSFSSFQILDPIKNTGSFTWNTNDKMFGPAGPNSASVLSGTKYKIKVCIEDICDESNGYFKITSPSNSNIIISGISGPQTVNVNQTATWKVKVKGSEQGNLSYSVNWGDRRMYFNEALKSSSVMPSSLQSATFSHTYQRSGNYTARFTVTDENGQSVTKSFKIKVRDTNRYEDYYRSGSTSPSSGQ